LGKFFYISGMATAISFKYGDEIEFRNNYIKIAKLHKKGVT